MESTEQLFIKKKKMEIQVLSTNEQLLLLNISWMFSKEEIQKSHTSHTVDGHF